MSVSIAIITVGIGFMMLIAGRPVYPIFVGGMSFLLGAILDNSFHIGPPAWGPLAIPLILAVLGFIAGYGFRRWMVYIAGFAAGGYLVYNLPKVFRAEPTWASPLTFIIAGALCVALLFIVFDAFLIFLSALTAVTMILTNARFGLLDPLVIFLILVVFGVVTQYLIFEYARPAPD
jgi:hypothetical protein